VLLKSIQVKSYKSVSDSGLVTFDQDVTCLVGKNESGKTAFLEAIYRLNPLPTGHVNTFDGLRDYPRRIYSRDKETIPETVVVETVFTLEPEDSQAVEEVLGEGLLTKNEVIVLKNYQNQQLWTMPINERQLVTKLVFEAGIEASLADDIETVAKLEEKLKAMDGPPPAVSAFLKGLKDFKPRQKVLDILSKQLPHFLYFNEYSIMPGRVSIYKLQHTSENQLQPGERTALSLIRLSGVKPEEFTEANYEARKAALEAAANQLTDEVFEYWSQNKDLSIELDVDFKSQTEPCGQPPFLDIRVRNQRHRVTLNFGERSHGFMWFFSFLAAFSEFKGKENLILLLDEPGLGLHAAAQADLLRFIDERLAAEHQVIYTTHSPFMVEANRFQRVRTVEDVDQEGTKVSADVLSTSKDTRFPLQAALGYDLAQTLFIGPNNLIVEGPADYIYLQVISEHLRTLGRTSLDPRWVIVPVGGLDKIPTFVALLGSQLNIAVVLEVSAGGSQKVSSLVQRGIIAGEKLISLTEFTHSSEADIEDLFEPSFYVSLAKQSGAIDGNFSLPRSNGRILKRIETATGSSFSHYQPARYLLEHQVELLGGIGDATLNRFEGLIRRANSLL